MGGDSQLLILVSQLPAPTLWVSAGLVTRIREDRRGTYNLVSLVDRRNVQHFFILLPIEVPWGSPQLWNRLSEALLGCPDVPI